MARLAGRGITCRGLSHDASAGKRHHPKGAVSRSGGSASWSIKVEEAEAYGNNSGVAPRKVRSVKPTLEVSRHGFGSDPRRVALPRKHRDKRHL